MNYRTSAAKAAVALTLTLLPGALFAGVVEGDATAVAYEHSGHVVTGVTNSWQMELLRHNAGTLHKFIGNPDIIPPGACRALAKQWNLAVFMNRSDAYFENKLLPRMAKKQCRFQFERVEIANAEGQYDLKAIGPAK